MFAVVIGVVVGLAILGGPLLWLDAPTSAVADSMVLAVADGGRALLEKVPGGSEHPAVVALFSTVLALTAPGLVALGLALAARAVSATRRALSGALLVLALASFAVLPAGQAAMLTIGALVATVVLLAPATVITAIALWALATVLAGHHALLLADGSAPAVTDAVASFTSLSGLVSVEFWRLVTVVVGLTPFALVAWSVLSDQRPTRR